MLYDLHVNRFDLPLDGPGNYRVRNGVIYTKSIEISATRQCNLSCRGCSHSSPIAAEQELDPENAAGDLKMLSRFMKCQTLYVLGGEPLLHSNLTGLLRAVRASEISERICIFTNGILLDRVDDETLSLVDEIYLSLYPLSSAVTARIRERAEEIAHKGIKVQTVEYASFRESISQEPTAGQAVIKTIYDTCQVAHVWRCLAVDSGKLYRCPQSMIFAEKTQDYSDALEIRKISNVETVLSFLENNQPIGACACCLGSIGAEFQHEQVRAAEWSSKLPQHPEDALDYDYAAKLWKDAHSGRARIRRKWKKAKIKLKRIIKSFQ